MTHPLFTLLVTQPHLLGNHADAYTELLSAEFASALEDLKKQAKLSAGVLFGWVVSAVLAGVSLLLLAVIPQAHMPAPWALIVIPLLPVAAALWYQSSLKRNPSDPAFGKIRQQLQADLALLREAAEQ